MQWHEPQTYINLNAICLLKISLTLSWHFFYSKQLHFQEVLIQIHKSLYIDQTFVNGKYSTSTWLQISQLNIKERKTSFEEKQILQLMGCKLATTKSQFRNNISSPVNHERRKFVFTESLTNTNSLIWSNQRTVVACCHKCISNTSSPWIQTPSTVLLTVYCDLAPHPPKHRYPTDINVLTSVTGHLCPTNSNTPRQYTPSQVPLVTYGHRCGTNVEYRVKVSPRNIVNQSQLTQWNVHNRFYMNQ